MRVTRVYYMSSFEPSDWKSTRVPQLAQLDSLQRCLICKDFLRAPVITSCNHTFCSQCIRQHLLSVNYCPLCKAELFESNLKRVVLLEEIVLCYQALRDDLIAILKKDLEVIDVDAEVPKEPEAVGKDPESGLVLCPVCLRKMKADHLQGSHLDYCLNGKNDPKVSLKRKSDVALFFSKKKPTNHEHFYFSESHKHHSDKKKLPKVDFASLSTAKVKEKLALLKLSTLGSRPQLELRYNHYYLLHNSNLDSNHLLTDVQLRQKLNQWEKSHQAFLAPSAATTIFGDLLLLKSLADKDFPVSAWLEKYKSEFRDLVRIARSRKEKETREKHDSLVSENRSSAPETSESEKGSAMTGSDTAPELQKVPDSAVQDKSQSAAPRTDNAFDFRNSTLFS